MSDSAEILPGTPRLLIPAPLRTTTAESGR